jgi:hypothetical protein
MTHGLARTRMSADHTIQATRKGSPLVQTNFCFSSHTQALPLQCNYRIRHEPYDDNISNHLWPRLMCGERLAGTSTTHPRVGEDVEKLIQMLLAEERSTAQQLIQGIPDIILVQCMAQPATQTAASVSHVAACLLSLVYPLLTRRGWLRSTERSTQGRTNVHLLRFFSARQRVYSTSTSTTITSCMLSSAPTLPSVSGQS